MAFAAGAMPTQLAEPHFEAALEACKPKQHAAALDNVDQADCGCMWLWSVVGALAGWAGTILADQQG